MGITAVEDLMEEALQQEAESRVGKTLRDKWHLDALLGVGGMAAVYAATHRNGMRGAVKILHPSQARDEAIKTRFLREGYLANKVDHPGAVRVLDDDVTEDGAVFLVMELLVGATLKARAMRRGGTLAARTVMLAADQLLDVLAAAHDKGIVHRDLKPENLFLTSAGLLKVLDYGIAGLCDAQGRSATRATRTGHAMGTPAFMSPEQARGRWDLVDGRSDLWSTAATMYELLVGRPVHDEGTASEIIAATFMKPARSLAEASCPEKPPKSLVAVVDRALMLEREERWPDARAMQAALRDAYREAFGEPLPPPLAEVSSRASSANLLSVPTPIEVVHAKRTTHESSEELPMAVAHRTLGEHEQGADAAQGRRRRVAAIVVGVAALSAAVLLLVMAYAGHGGTRGASAASSAIVSIAPSLGALPTASPPLGSAGPTQEKSSGEVEPAASVPKSPPPPLPAALKRPVPRATAPATPPATPPANLGALPRPPTPPAPPAATTTKSTDPFDRRL